MAILLTFDVEDWFQVENFKEYIPYNSWPMRELRVEKNTIALLDTLDEATGLRGDNHPVRATFFVLGWLVERCPDLVQEIVRRGHEVASHGFWHHLCYSQSSSDLLVDLRQSKELLEEISGQEVWGYRAPSFSVNDQVLAAIRRAGYLYDSSYNSYDGHGRYGIVTLPPGQPKASPLFRYPGPFYELPVTNLTVGGKTIPWGGGGYFRLLPGLVHRAGMRHILRRHGCFTFYMHPWEIDPAQPRVKEAKASFRFRHYVNLHSSRQKLATLLAAFVNEPFVSCRDFVCMANGEGTK